MTVRSAAFINLPRLAVSLLTGMAVLFTLPHLPSAFLVCLVLTLAGLICLRWPSAVTYSVLGLCVGFAWAYCNARLVLSERMLFEQGAIEAILEARVSSLVRQQDTTLAFRVDAQLPFGSSNAVAVDLRWYDFPTDARQPRPGELWQLDVRLRAPRGLSNPGRRHREDYAFRNAVAASGYVRRGDNRLLEDRGVSGSLVYLRDWLSRDLIQSLDDSNGGPLLVALAVGDRQYLKQSHWRVLRRTGLSHLVAISGLHVGIVATLGYVLGALAGGLRGHSIVVGCFTSALMALAYAALAGFSIPTQRALIVVFVLLAARLARRELRSTHALSFALILILLFDPMSPLDTGFWLSFSAVTVILYFSAGHIVHSRLRSLWSIQLAVLIGLMPLTIIFFGQVSLAAPLVNFFVLPLFGVVLVPAVLCGVVAYLAYADAGAFILRGIARVLDKLWPCLEQVSQVQWLIHQAGHTPVVAVVLAVAGAGWCLAPRGWPARWVGVICFIPALTTSTPAPIPGDFDVTLLDVGQGLATVVRTNTHVLIFDAGPAWRSGKDAAGSVVIPYLRQVGISRIDRLVISHGDADHAGGLQTLLEHYPDVSVLAGGVADHAPCERGQRWFWDGVSFEIIHPGAGENWSDNNASCVLKVSNARFCVLLTGDIEAPAERALVHTQVSALDCDLLSAPHHGSETSSTQAFVDALSASHVFVSIGYANRWGFPRPQVVERWRRSGALLFDTASMGAISARIDRDGEILLRLHRCERQRFWRPPCKLLVGPAGHTLGSGGR